MNILLNENYIVRLFPLRFFYELFQSYQGIINLVVFTTLLVLGLIYQEFKWINIYFRFLDSSITRGRGFNIPSISVFE